MKHRAIIDTALWLMVGLAVGAMFSYWITQTIWPIVILTALAVILAVLRFLWPKIAEGVIGHIKERIEINVVQLVVDNNQKSLQITFGIRNTHPAMITFKSIDHVTIGLNNGKVVVNTLEAESSEIVQLMRCKLKYLPTGTKILASDIELLIADRNRMACWDINMTLRFDSAWGEFYKIVKDLRYEEIPRIGGV